MCQLLVSARRWKYSISTLFRNIWAEGALCDKHGDIQHILCDHCCRPVASSFRRWPRRNRLRVRDSQRGHHGQHRGYVQFTGSHLVGVCVFRHRRFWGCYGARDEYAHHYASWMVCIPFPTPSPPRKLSHVSVELTNEVQLGDGCSIFPPWLQAS